MNLRLKKTLLVTLNVLLGVYLLLAVTSFNSPKETYPICTKVSINVEDENTNGFLSAGEVKKILEKNRLYPFKKRMDDINPRDIEDYLKGSPFVNSAQCYKTTDGQVFIGITQRLPIVRIKSISGADYYIDDHGGIMPNSKYTSDLIIATGYINEWFAKNYLVLLATELMNDDFWKNQIVQINVLPDKGIELVPRVGDHIVYLGRIPQTRQAGQRKALVGAFVKKKMERLKKFYKYGLNHAGWNKYYCIDMEFDNQIICKKRKLNNI